MIFRDFLEELRNGFASEFEKFMALCTVKVVVLRIAVVVLVNAATVELKTS